jgi:CheY-like chemotaxis protein
MNHQRILVVDDNETSSHLLARSIREMGQDYEVVAVDDGFAALIELYTDIFDLMLTKYKLPTINGLELAGLAHRVAPAMRVALITDRDLPGIRAKAKRQHLKLDEYLHKPFTFIQLLQVVKGDNKFPY